MDFEFELAEYGRRKRRAHAGQPRRLRTLGMLQRRIRFEEFDGKFASFREQLADERRQFWNKRVGSVG